jgi:hypothetical protein
MLEDGHLEIERGTLIKEYDLYAGRRKSHPAI